MMLYLKAFFLGTFILVQFTLRREEIDKIMEILKHFVTFQIILVPQTSSFWYLGTKNLNSGLKSKFLDGSKFYDQDS